MKRKFYLDDYGLITTPYDEAVLNSRIMVLKNGCEIEHRLNVIGSKLEIKIADDIKDADRYIVCVNEEKYPVEMRFITHTRRFDYEYMPDLETLGSFYRRNTVKFRVWAPFADEVYVVLNGKALLMEYTQRGVYELKVKGAYEKSYYHYEIIRNEMLFKFKDPFSYSCVKDKEESYILDMRKLSFRNVKTNISLDPIIYEVSVRDFSSDVNAPFKAKGKFEAFSEKNLSVKDHPIGTEYIKHIGVTHVQLMPVQTFDLDHSDYNWGYNPMEFNTIHWGYVVGTDAYSPIYEFRKLVDHLHRNNIKVCLDVVYNHVYKVKDYALEKALPYYFFRYEPDGRPGDASGCGNELRSEAPFFREYLRIINKRLVDIFDIDGLRFDLMGILDVNTINFLNNELKSIKRDFLMYGEGWHMGDIVPDELKASLNNTIKMPEIQFFNPHFRDSLKGGFGDRYNKGYIYGNMNYLETVKAGLEGSYYFGLNKDQTLNYAECHDNMTFYDKISCFDFSEKEKNNIVKLCLALVVLAKGMPFIHAGQEGKRTKGGIDNTYNLPDSINRIDWQRMAENEDSVRYLRKLIELRKSNNIFRSDSEVMFSDFYGCLIYSIGGFDIIINPTEHEYNYHGKTKYKKILNTDSKYVYDLSEFKIPQYSLVVCEK